MAVDDLWYLPKRDPASGDRLPAKRHGKGKRWRVRYADDTGATVTKLFDKTVDAERGTVMLAGQPGVVDSEGVRQATVDLSDSHQRGRPGAESDRRAIPKHDQQGR
jgi:hypothetical protein